jgi:hypothetical protein
MNYLFESRDNMVVIGISTWSSEKPGTIIIFTEGKI